MLLTSCIATNKYGDEIKVVPTFVKQFLFNANIENANKLLDLLVELNGEDFTDSQKEIYKNAVLEYQSEADKHYFITTIQVLFKNSKNISDEKDIIIDDITYTNRGKKVWE